MSLVINRRQHNAHALCFFGLTSADSLSSHTFSAAHVVWVLTNEDRLHHDDVACSEANGARPVCVHQTVETEKLEGLISLPG